MPSLSPFDEGGTVNRAIMIPTCHEAIDRRKRGVSKRAHHANDVLQRRLFSSPLFNWPCGLSFKIDEDEVFFLIFVCDRTVARGRYAQCLAQVIVAVDSDALPGCNNGLNRTRPLDKLGPAR